MICRISIFMLLAAYSFGLYSLYEYRQVILTDVPPYYPGGEYNRAAFGRWIDADGDCQSTRDEILMMYASKYELSDNGCSVVSGSWVSMYTGDVISSPIELDIDHVLSLKWAWDHGAKHWTYQERVAFANDFDNLVPVEASLNRSKGSRMEWLPPYNRGWYKERVGEIKLKYKLEE